MFCYLSVLVAAYILLGFVMIVLTVIGIFTDGKYLSMLVWTTIVCGLLILIFYYMVTNALGGVFCGG